MYRLEPDHPRTLFISKKSCVLTDVVLAKCWSNSNYNSLCLTYYYGLFVQCESPFVCEIDLHSCCLHLLQWQVLKTLFEIYINIFNVTCAIFEWLVGNIEMCKIWDLCDESRNRSNVIQFLNRRIDCLVSFNSHIKQQLSAITKRDINH